MSEQRIVVEITYNSRGLNEILVGDISLDIGAIKGKSIEEWFIPFHGRISWKGLIPEIKEALQDSDAHFTFEFIGREEHRRIFEECLRRNGLIDGKEDTMQEGQSPEEERNQKNAYDKENHLDLDEILRKARRLENQGKWKEALEQYSILAQQGNAEGEYKSTELRSRFLEEGKEKHSEYEKYQIFKLYEAAAEQGYVEAMRCLAECYLHGDGVNEEPAEAALWFQKAAEAGDIESMRYTGFCYEEGYGVDEDKKSAIGWYKKGIDNNDAESGFYLGFLYFQDDTLDADNDKARKYWKKSSKLGDADAQYCYALITDDGDEVEWLRKAVEQDHPAAQYKLGERYLNGNGVEEDEKRGITLIQKSAEQEDKNAQCMMGRLYFHGRGFREDDAKAYEWFDKAAENGSVEALFYLGQCFENGYGVDADKERAVDLYKKAAEVDDAAAQYCLGNCYYYGDGVEEDKEEAVSWYSKASENGNVAAQFSLGFCYFNGQGVNKDEKEAVKYFLEAAEQEHDLAQRYLGLCYEEGYGTDKNLAEAFRWYKKSAEQGNAKAQLYLGNCYSDGRGTDKDARKAVEWYQRSADQGNASAQLNLGWSYAYGEGVKRSDEDAFMWLKRAGETEEEEGTTEESADLLCKVANNYDYLLMPEEIREKIDKESKKSAARTLVGAGIAIAGLFVATPLAIAGGVTELSGLLGGRDAEKKHYRAVLQTERGKEMLHFYEKAAQLGSKDAKRKLKDLKKY